MSISVTVDGEDYNKCVVSSTNQWSSSKPGVYGAGLGNDKTDPYKIERISKVAEVAVAKLFNSDDPDFQYIQNGDGGKDIEICGMSVDIKCSMRNYGANVFRAIDKRGTSTVKADLYIFCYLVDECQYTGAAKIEVVGYLTKAEVDELPFFPPRKKFTTDKINKDIKHIDMIPVEELIRDLGL